MVARAAENEIYFASVNYTLRYQDSATSLIDPDGGCLAHVPYGEEQMLVCDLDLSLATGRYARRFNADFYPPDWLLTCARQRGRHKAPGGRCAR